MSNTATIIKPKLLAADGITGEIVKGKFVATYENEASTKDGRTFTSIRHLFIDSNDQKVYINGSARLNKALKQVDPHTEVSISYGGKKDMDNGRSFHDFTVNILPSNG